MRLLVDEAYHKAVTALLTISKHRIFIMGYLFGWPNSDHDLPLAAFYSKLIEARRRAVDCRILMNYTFPADSVSKQNNMTSGRLVREGIDCRFLPRSRCIHAKMLIVDSVVTILGSHNWTRKANDRNLEVSLSVDHRDLVKEAESVFLALWGNSEKMPANSLQEDVD